MINLQSMKLNEQLQYIRPDGVKYRLHTPPSRVVMSEEGFGTPPLEYVTDRAPFQHGDTVRDFFLQPRPMQIVIMQNFCSRADWVRGRDGILDAVRPNRITDFNTQGKLLWYRADGSKRQIDVVLESGPGFAPPQGGWREWSFTEVLRFVAHDPAWYDPTQQTTSFVQSLGELVFPITFPITFASFGTISTLAYVGTWLEYPTIVIIGPIIGPRIENLTTGNVLALDYTIPDGMSATITLRGRKTITRSDGVNLLNYLTSDSDLTEFSLQPDPIAPNGDNQIQVTGSGTNTNTSVVIEWYKRYFGV